MALTKIYDMAYELNDAGEVLIEQDTGGQVDRVYLHPIHVRLIASEMGLLNGDEDAWRRVEALGRRLRLLRDRIADLDGRLWSVPTYPPGSNSDDADCIYSDATPALANEFCADLAPPVRETRAAADADKTKTQPAANPAATRGVERGQTALELEAK